MEFAKREISGRATMIHAIRAATVDMYEALTSPTFWLIIAGVALICFISGPFGTLDRLPWGILLIYWALQVTVAGIAGLWAHSLVRTQGWTRFSTLLIVSLLFGLVVFGLVVIFSLALLAPIGKYPGYLDLFLNSFPSGALIFLLLALVHPKRISSVSAEVPSTDVRPKLLDRLKQHHTAQQILSLSAQDHYVEVATDTGAELCLVRLADAIAESAPQEGIQIHRSHWVARVAIETLQTNGASPQVLLTDGRKFPISKSRLTELRRYLEPRPETKL